MGSLEDRFADIAQEAIHKAESVDCTLEEFREGLRTMFDELRERLTQVNEELRHVEYGSGEHGG